MLILTTFTWFNNIKIQDFLKVLAARTIAIFFILGFHICTRNGEESLYIVTPAQFFENYQLDTSSIEEGMY